MLKRIVLTTGVAASIALVGPALALGPRVVDPIPETIPRSDVTIGFATVADGLANPVAASVAPGDNKAIYVAEQRGKIWQIDLDGRGKGSGQQPKREIADVSAVVVPLGCFGINYDERGLLGLAFHPDYKKNGLMYTLTSENQRAARCAASSPEHDNVVREWKVNDPKSDSPTVDPASSRIVLSIVQPQFNHNGGEIRFGPDGMLYVATGDGGAADDQGPGHNPQIGNAQDLKSMLGKILRIDPNAATGYNIPADNPFVGQEGAKGEIWAYGFRNPYRMSFDSKTGELYVGDVGQNDIEEVDLVVKGGNYGWRVKEGTFAFDPNGAQAGFVTADVVTGNYIDPIAQYDHCTPPVTGTTCAGREGVSVINGFVYRGKKVKALRDKYVLAEYSTGFFTSAGRVFVLDGGVKELRYNTGDMLGMSVLGMAEDAKGELYVMGKTGAAPGNTGITDPANLTGKILRIVEG